MRGARYVRLISWTLQSGSEHWLWLSHPCKPPVPLHLSRHWQHRRHQHRRCRQNCLWHHHHWYCHHRLYRHTQLLHRENRQRPSAKRLVPGAVLWCLPKRGKYCNSTAASLRLSRHRRWDTLLPSPLLNHPCSLPHFQYPWPWRLPRRHGLYRRGGRLCHHRQRRERHRRHRRQGPLMGYTCLLPSRWTCWDLHVDLPRLYSCIYMVSQL